MANVKLFEHRSIDYVPLAERHGKVWHLWPVWFSGEAHLATVATGVVGRWVESLKCENLLLHKSDVRAGAVEVLGA